MAARVRKVFLAVTTLVVVAACSGLGVWQLRRLDARTTFNDQLISQSRQSVATIESAAQIEPRLKYRLVRLTGSFDVSGEIILRARSFRGRAGNHLLTPLRLDGGGAVVVDRGWVPLELDNPPVSRARPAADRVTVTGIVIPSEVLAGSAATTGIAQKRLGRLDLFQIAAQLPYPIARLAVAAQAQSPAQQDLPIATGVPAPGKGPHLFYAIQWFIFATIAAITGMLLLRSERTTSPPVDTAGDHSSSPTHGQEVNTSWTESV